MAGIVTKVLFQVSRPSFLDSDLVREKTGGVTLDSASVPAGADGRKVVKAGTPVGKNALNGKYVPCTYNEEEETWTPTPEFLTLVDADLTKGDENVPVMDWGRVVASALPVEVNDALIKALPGIVFVTPQGAVSAVHLLLRS